MKEDGKRFPDEERPKLPWDDEPEISGKKRKKTTWERFGDVVAYRRKIMICGAVVGVIATIVVEFVYIPGALLVRYESKGVRGSWLDFFSWLEIAGSLAGAGVGWVIARLMIGY